MWALNTPRFAGEIRGMKWFLEGEENGIMVINSLGNFGIGEYQFINYKSRVLPTPGVSAHYLPAAPSTHEKKKKIRRPDAFNPSQNAII
jgi:hypothetical protein